MSRIYTRGGDRGETGLRGGARVPKSDSRIEASGDLDELNACLGIARAEMSPAMHDLAEVVERIQHELFILGAEIASSLTPGEKPPAQHILPRHIQRLEADIDHFYAPFKDLNTFVLPSGGRAGSHLHLARTIARRAERALSHLSKTHPVREEVMSYVNRLSDALFALALSANRADSFTESHPDYTR